MWCLTFEVGELSPPPPAARPKSACAGQSSERGLQCLIHEENRGKETHKWQCSSSPQTSCYLFSTVHTLVARKRLGCTSPHSKAEVSDTDSEITGCGMRIDLAALRLFMWPSTLPVEVGFSFLPGHLDICPRLLSESWSHGNDNSGLWSRQVGITHSRGKGWDWPLRFIPCQEGQAGIRNGHSS